MPTLGPSTDYTGAAVTQGGKKTFIATLVALVIARLGTAYAVGPASVASAATVDLTAVTTVRDIVLTGAADIDVFNIAAGDSYTARAAGAFKLKVSASLNTQTGADIVCAVGDSFVVRGTAANVSEIITFTRAVQAAAAVPKQIQPLSVAMNTPANAMTITLAATSLDFRSATLNSGAVATVANTALTLVVPQSATLGSLAGVVTTYVVVEINNGGTPELAVANLGSGLDLTETGVISTTIMNAGANSAGVFYSTTARASVPYRYVGKFAGSQATIGLWVSALTLVQGAGGQAVAPGVGGALLSVTILTANGTHTVNSLTRKMFVEGVGGGGAGGGSSAGVGDGAGAGGGSGEYRFIHIGLPAASYAFTIGAGGAGVGGSPGSAGGSSVGFGLTCTAGSGGGGPTAGQVSAGGSGGTGGTGGTGFNGRSGSSGVGESNAAYSSGGRGGDSFFGAGGRGGTMIATAVAAAANSGGGGAGSCNSATLYAGAGGGSGCFRVFEYA